MKNLFNQGSKFRMVAWGGLLTAISVLLAILGSAMSFLDAIYLAATPIVIACLYGGIVFGLQVSFASVCITSMILGPFPAGLYFLASAIPSGLIIGNMLRKKQPISSIVMFSAITLSLCLIVTTYISYLAMGRTFQEDIAESAKVAKTFLEMSSTNKNIAEDDIMKMIYMVIPATIILTSLIYSIYLYFFNTWILKKLKLVDNDFNTDLHEIFHYPKYFAYIFACSLIALFLGRTSGNDLSSTLGINLFYIFGFLFFFKGLFLVRIVLFVLVKNMVSRLFFGLVAMTIMAPVVSVIGFYFCLTQKDIEIRRK